MKLFEKLDHEICQEQKGTYSPYYYLYKLYKRNIAAAPNELHAESLYALFTETEPRILKNEQIVGNTLPLYTEQEDFVLEHARGQVKLFCRGFINGKDHYAPNYDHLIAVGIPGLIEEIDQSLCTHQKDPDKCATLHAMKKTLCGFLQMIQNHANAAAKKTGLAEYDVNRLTSIVQNCRAIAAGAPKSFAEALQLVWFCHIAFLMETRGAMALGRMDQYLYPFYKADIESGNITDDQVIELLENVFIKLKGDNVVNICIGGQNAKGDCQINGLSRCILKAVGNCNVPGPNLSLRLTENTPDEFLDECLKTIGTGLGYPALMNDDVNIAALKKYGYDQDDIYNYCMVGCIENFLPGQQPPWSDARFDTPRFFDYLFNNGISKTNRSMGIDTGDISKISSMQEFMKAFEKQLRFGVEEYVAVLHSKTASIFSDFYPQPFLSCFCDGCIEKGLDINGGGSKYPSVHGACLMGIGTTADSLAAIEKVVFIDKQASLTDIKNALNCNFEGYEDLRQKLINAPKYGNNDDFVDKYAVWFLQYLSSLFKEYKTYDGGGIYVAAAANVNNISAGKIINATPDGRKRGEPLSDAASPTYGKDTRGTTATVLSLSKPDYSLVACGTVVNQKFSPSMFSDDKRKTLLALIRTYFKKGGQEIQINSTSRKILEDAMEHPENHKNLVVRVSGFSAFYVTLEKAVQLDILSRTQKDY